MEEVAGNLLEDDAFSKPFGLLRLYLRPNSAAKYLRGIDPTLPPQLRELIDQLLEWSDKKLDLLRAAPVCTVKLAKRRGSLGRITLPRLTSRVSNQPLSRLPSF
jgi:hypothetical protein